jgi:hypothetical protein
VSGLYLSRGLYPEEYLRPTADYILEVQRPWGEIPWFPGGHTDPWDHVEAAMALSIAGEHEGAKRAYRWLADCQLGDGSWWRAYQDNQPQDPDRRETNYVAYIATGIWHHYLITGDRGFLEESYPFVRAAIDFVVRLQGLHGEIDWAVDTNGVPMGDALLTGCSSIFKSLECACHIASTLGEPMDNWVEARRRLGVALRTKPERFDRTWASKSRYAMDWFYPIITGWITGAEAKERIHRRWQEFVEPGLGCRCEIQEPWVTVAESCELTLALLAAGERAKAGEVFAWLTQWRAGNGAWWTGYQLVEDMLWPDEKPTWTAGAILLAADALTGHTAASDLFLTVLEPESQSDARQALRRRS